MASATKVASVGGDKNGKQRTVATPKTSRPQPAKKVSSRLQKGKVAKPTKLRASITPGTVLILLAGRFRGRRVVFLKQLPSGLLLVTGPYKCNGVPLKRVNQAYVIATSTKIDISSVKIDEKASDELFKNPKETKAATDFFAKEKPKKELSDVRQKLQQELDTQLMPIIKKVQLLKTYLGARFSLQKGQAPHLMKF